jgi:hypothetical protein
MNASPSRLNLDLTSLCSYRPCSHVKTTPGSATPSSLPAFVCALITRSTKSYVPALAPIFRRPRLTDPDLSYRKPQVSPFPIFLLIVPAADDSATQCAPTDLVCFCSQPALVGGLAQCLEKECEVRSPRLSPFLPVFNRSLSPRRRMQPTSRKHSRSAFSSVKLGVSRSRRP